MVSTKARGRKACQQGSLMAPCVTTDPPRRQVCVHTGMVLVLVQFPVRQNKKLRILNNIETSTISLTTVFLWLF